MFGKDTVGGASLTIIFGVLGVLAPFAAIFVATFMGKSEIAFFNSSMLLILSMLLMIFLVINSFHNYLSDNKRIFLLGALFLFFSIISFIFNLHVFIKI